MIDQPICCSTCKHLQIRARYCHAKKETRYNILKFIVCSQYAKSWRDGWHSDADTYQQPKAEHRVDRLAWTGVR